MTDKATLSLYTILAVKDHLCLSGAGCWPMASRTTLRCMTAWDSTRGRQPTHKIVHLYQMHVQYCVYAVIKATFAEQAVWMVVSSVQCMWTKDRNWPTRCAWFVCKLWLIRLHVSLREELCELESLDSWNISNFFSRHFLIHRLTDDGNDTERT